MNTAIIPSGGSPREPQNSVIVFVIVIVLALLMAGCKGSQHLAVTERITHDTCYISNMQYDSIYIDNLHFIDRASEYSSKIYVHPNRATARGRSSIIRG